MNGARSTYMRKGYLLTALAAAVLLAASPGTASAQVEATLAGELAEGAAADITVTAEISIPEAGAAGTVTITAAVAAVAAAGTTHEADDVVLARPALVFTYPAGPADDSDTNTSLTTDMTFSGTIPVQAVHGDDDAEDEVTSITVTPVVVGGAVGKDGVALAAPAALPLTVKDDETQTYVLSLPAGATPTENTTISVTVAAVPPHEDESTTLTLHSSDPVNYVPGVSFIVVGSTTATPAGVNSGAVAIPAPANDQNRVTDTITLSAYSGVAGAAELRASLDFDVADIHTLPAASAVTAVAMDMDDDTMEVMEIEEGGDAVNVMISVDRGAVADDDASTSEALTVEVMAANAEQATDYRLTPTMVTLPAAAANGEQSATEMLMLSAVSDQDVGVEDLVLNLVLSGEAANGSGTETGTFTIAIVDNTMKQIEPKPTDEVEAAIVDAMNAGGGDEGVNPGESFIVMTSDLFTLAGGYTASFGTQVDGDAVSVSTSGDRVTITAETAGEATITVTGTAKAAVSSFTPSQTVSNVAEIAFPVMVVDKALVVTLEMPANVMNGNIVEGQSYDIVASTNRAVTAADGSVEVMIMRDRAASDADDGDFSVDNATITAGNDSATATLMVTEDMEPDSGTNDNMGEVLVLYGKVNGEDINSLTFTIWDQAVPALPLFGQLLLALFLMLGGARLYRRRQG